MAKAKPGEPSWFWRRSMAFAIVGFCMLTIAWMIDRADTELNATIVSGCFWLMGGSFLVYGGFASVQDLVAIYVTRTARPYADPPVEPTPAPEQTVVVVDKGGGE